MDDIASETNSGINASSSNFSDPSLLNSGKELSQVKDSAKKEKFLSLAEASQLAGVSSSTIMRFAEAGYFRIHNKNSEAHFSDQEISDVFGVTVNFNRVKIKESAASSSAVQNNAADSKQQDSQVISSEDPNTTTDSQRRDQAASNQASSNQTGEKTVPTLASQIEVIIENDAGEEMSAKKLQSEQLLEEEAPTQKKEALEPFKKVLELQEELLTQKNSIIADLIKERDWLRSRLEKMEEKSERDQMLLMVESQKVRTLIAAPENANQKQLGSSDASTGSEGGLIKRALTWLNS